MKKPHIIEAIGGAATAVLTGTTAVNLAGHDVGLLTILAVALSMLSTGLTLTGQITKAATTEAYRCSAQGCTVEIRATRNHAPERLAVLREMATDHSRHGSAAV
ncbi:hypothetical protein ADK57_25940 [Streptomyces sp. MMG1533]|uniref:hypothetical protein n=1 Tax=Streptomyces sp. MMG1533 TaxID=1415546 RepID=UPI0006B01AF4|nr:hypothetical protein [Streptomyces sp. MMG1533]KOU62076.1 hypothetical protein ADK57_25940 [Streptomyces sp. MMG1533]